MVAKVKMGSDMSNKQLAQSVVQHQRLQFDLTQGDPVSGYLAGIDDYTYLVVIGGKPVLLHKGNVVVVHLRTDRTLEHERPEVREAIEPILGPFRDFCSRVILNNGEPKVEGVAAVTLLNFDTELDVLGVTRIHVEHVAKPRLATETSHHMVPVNDWGWREVMDYVLAEIERRLGPQDHNVAKEQAIFKRFCKTWGADASRIARYAFEVKNGWWAERPVELWRFSTGADPYFAVKIADKLRGGENFVR